MIMSKISGAVTIGSAAATFAAVAEEQLMAAIVALFGTIIGGVSWYALKAVPDQHQRIRDLIEANQADSDKKAAAQAESQMALVEELKEGRLQNAQHVEKELAYLRGRADGTTAQSAPEDQSVS